MKEIINLQGLGICRDATFQVNPDKKAEVPAGCIYINFIKVPAGLAGVYKSGQQYGYIEDPGLPPNTVFELQECGKAGHARVVVINDSEMVNSGKGANMTGNVYEGVVVRTTQVPAGEGLTSSVGKSEIILTVPAFLAKDDATAQATVMAAAVAKGFKLDDPVVVVEVKVRKYA